MNPSILRKGNFTNLPYHITFIDVNVNITFSNTLVSRK